MVGKNHKTTTMKEAFLYYLWENRLITGTLNTTEGQAVEIVQTGYRNQNSGPDYLEAKIKIDGEIWAGHVEIHVKTSDWNRHGHQNDKAYRNVILHVVYEHDATVNEIPTLSLKGHFDERLFAQYEQFLASKNWIPCQRDLHCVNPLTRLSWMERMAVERLETKADYVTRIAKSCQFDWEDVFYRLMMRYFGMKVNNEAFETLAAFLPYKILRKHADNLTQLEAMLIGCAGFLEHPFKEAYPQLLQREFTAMRAKFNLSVMPSSQWRYMRMRPVNFPTVRLAQLAMMIHQHNNPFSNVKEASNANEVKSLFNVTASNYWDSHYRFETSTEPKPKHLGEATADVLLINAVVPLLFCYGKAHKEATYCEKALRFLEETAAEVNSITHNFTANGMRAQNAMHSQAQLHLYQQYCRKKRCLECQIGNVLLRST